MLIEASLDTLVTIGPEGEITDVNAATEVATGQPRADLIGTDFSGYFTEPELARSGFEQAFLAGSIRDFPLELRHRDGHVMPVLFNASVYRDPAGRVRGVFAAARDITSIKRAQEALRESEERLRAIVDTAPVGIDEVTLAGQFVTSNSYFCQLVGYPSGELASLTVTDLLHPDDREADAELRRRLISGEIPAYTSEKRYLRKDGSIVLAEASRALLRDQDGRPVAMVGAFRDITGQRRAEVEIRALNASLEERVAQRTAELARANENLEAFTYSVSHDLRAPLRALSGFGEALAEEYADKLGEAGRDYVERIRAASQRMGILIDDLLKLSRLSRAELRLRPVDLSAEAVAIAGELRSRDPARVATFVVQPGVRASADQDLIRSVLQNLLENAWKFTSQRDEARIEFGAMAPGESAEVCCFVRDNGAGFDPAYAGKLFKPFQRLHAATEFPGNGIGLASVQRIIERHGGRAWAEGSVGQGATVYFSLKAAPPG